MAIPEETYCQERLDKQISWYGKASRSNKQAFLRLRLLQILLGTAITIFSPFANRFSWGSLALSMAGGGVAVAGSLMALYRHQENWLRYRGLSQALQHEKYLFLTGTPPYGASDSPFTRLVSTSEGLMAEESSQWIHQMSPPAAAPVTQAEQERPKRPEQPQAAPQEGR